MTTRPSRTIRHGLLFALLAGLPGAAQRVHAQQSDHMTPVVLVIHGVGGGNRPEGWSADVARAWRMGDVREITFRNEAHDATSNVDAAYWAGDWAFEVQRQIKAEVAKDPRRPIIIVSHSWGTVATAMALTGGSGGGNSTDLVNRAYQVPPIDLGGARIAEWVTLGSPLGNRTLGRLNVDVPIGRPSVVDHWTNFYDSADPVSSSSHNLDGATNVEVFRSGRWYDPTGISAHLGIWINPAVTKFVQSLESAGMNAAAQTGKLAAPSAPKAAPANAQPAPNAQPGAPDYALVCKSAMTAIERGHRAVFGPLAQVRMQWVRPLTYDKGDCVGGYVLWVKRPEDKTEWSPTKWYADAGDGRMAVSGIVQKYKNDNPDLQWTPTTVPR